MKSFYFIRLVILTALLAGWNVIVSAQTSTYSSAGTYTYIVPAGVTAVGIDMAGAQGGNGYPSYSGGKGGRIQCTLAVTPGMTLTVYVGGKGTNASTSCTYAGGSNGGGNGACYAGGGGGASDIRIGGTGLANRVCVAAGGGGGSDWCGETGGDGGGATGGNGNNCGSYASCCAGAGGTQSAGGAGASYGAASGSLGTGGTGSSYGGGGGGGYYGGGGGYYGSGGGGSSYPLTGATTAYCTAVTNTSGYQTGNGSVSICAPNLGVISGNVPLCVGQTMTLSSTAPGGTWSSANTAIATVSSSGLVTAMSAGSVNITYTANATCGAGYLVTSVLVNPSPNAIVTPSTTCPGAVTTATDATTGGVWSSTDITKATVGSATGTVTGIASGTFTLSYTITATGCAAVLPMTVNPLPPAITGTPRVCASGAVTVLGDASPGGTWTSSTPTVATVTGTGVVTGVAAGNTVITYTLPTGCMISQPVTVNPLPSAISGTAIVCAGANTTLSDAGGGTWTSSNTALAAVGLSSGVVTGVAAGTPTITYTLPTGCFTTTNILVNAVPAAITGTSSVCAGGTTTLSSATPGGIWTSSNTSYATVLPASGTVTGVASGTPTISYTLGTGCATTMSFVVNPLPVAYSVTGGGGYCVGASGTHIGLSFGSTGVNYKLYNGTTLVTTVGGTSSGLDFGMQTATGTYTVVAVDASTSCSNNMTGSTTVSINPLPNVFSLSGGGSFCAGSTGPSVVLSSSDPSVNYQLYVGGVPTGSSMPGTGSSLTFGPVSAGGTYTAVAVNPSTSCTINMSGSASVTVNPLPVAYTLNAGGGYCTGGTGVDVVLSGSDVSATYQLFYGGVATGAPVSGTGTSLHFGPHTTPGIYTVSAINTSGCSNNMSGSTTVSVNPLPITYNVSGGGNYCAGGSGVHVGLNLSSPGVNYQLKLGSVPVGAPVSGTSAGLDFGLQTATGSYTVVATDQITGCTQNMAGSATVGTTALPVAYTVTGGGSYCAGGSGLHIGLSGSAAGVHYQLFNGLSTVGSGLNGTGAALDFGIQPGTGTYTVVATNPSTTCANNMTGSATIAINARPATYAVASSGTSYCAGGAGIDITLPTSDFGINYQLYRGSTPVGPAMAGTGSMLDFLNQTTAGTYTITASNTTTGCTASMAGSAVVSINALPTKYSVTGGGGYCVGGLGVHIGLSNSASGITYQLFNSTGPVGAAVSGIGSSIDFGYNNTVDVYQVAATNVLTGCADTMLGSAAVVQNPLPNAYNVTGGGNYCLGGSGAAIGLDNSDSNVSYQLFFGVTPSGSAVTGSTGSSISFGSRVPVGSYTVIATDNITHCASTMTGSAAVGTYPLPAVHTVSGGGIVCVPGGTGANINLDASDAGVNYQLYYMGAPVDSVLSGTGSSMSFGLHSGAGTYNVVATDATTSCHASMSGSATITTQPQPAAQTVTGGGGYCVGGTGVTVGLANTETGIHYQLYNSGAPVGSVVTGTGSALSFGLQTAAGTYTVVASPGGACQLSMADSATVRINALPAHYTVTGGGSFCAGGTGVSVGLSNSDAGVKYQLYLGTTPVGTMVTGTGSALNFGLQTTAGTYTTMAVDTTTTCVSPRGAGGNALVVNMPVPAAYNVTGGGHYCTGGTGVHVTLAGSTTNVNYQLYFNGTASGSPMAGTGTLLDFGSETVAGNYTVVGTDAATSCISNMTDTAVVAIDPLQMPVVTITAHPGFTIVKQQRDTLVATATTAGTNPTYQWYIGGFPIPGATNSMYISRNFANNDSVTCIVTSNGGDCTGYSGAASKKLTVNSAVGVQQIVTGDMNVNVIPNPNRGTFNVVGSLSSADDQEISLEVVDLLGHVVYSNKSIAKNGDVNERIQLSSGIANGMYVLSLHAGADSKVFHVVVAQ